MQVKIHLVCAKGIFRFVCVLSALGDAAGTPRRAHFAFTASRDSEVVKANQTIDATGERPSRMAQRDSSFRKSTVQVERVPTA
jgi:hypothetical protein